MFGIVSSANEFEHQRLVIGSYSDLVMEVFGEKSWLPC